MINNNKILTVSYGTFSCTLEGFDDSFGTMKAIAEYFRDLSADDRYFGAEPAQPDAQMLARIAQREISRHVEAREDEGRIVLSAQDAQQAAAIPVVQAEEVEVQTPTEEAPIAKATELADVADLEDVAAAPEEVTLPPVEEIAEQAPVLEETPVAEETLAAADTVVEVEDVAQTPAETLDEAPVEDVIVEEAVEDLAAEDTIDMPDIVPSLPDAEVEAFFADAATQPQGSDDFVEEIAEDVVASAPVEAEESGSEKERAKADSIAEKLKRIRAVVSQQSEAPEAPDYSEDQHAEATAAKIAFEDETADEDQNTPENDVLADTLRDLEDALEADDAVEVQEDVIADEDSEEDDIAAILSRLEESDVSDASATADEITEIEIDDDMDDNILAAMDSIVAAPDADDLDDLGDDHLFGEASPADEEEKPKAAAPVRTRVLKVKRATLEAAIKAGQLEEYEDEEEDAPAGRRGPNSSLSPEAEEELARDLAELEADIEASDAVPAQPRDMDDAINPHADIRGDAEDDLSRLMDETNNQMEEPESATRRDAFTHLRAAVAAKKADEAVGGDLGNEDSGEAYRDDLANVVRPRRPISGGRNRTERPADQRPAPLKLVAEQRIDVESVASATPVRPRRVATVVHNPKPAAAESAASFTDFAADVGADKLPDLLEAAAAYLSFVEGHAQFSRPQLMTKVRQVEKENFTREESLRSFGKLLREGKIEKLKGGRFQASDQIGFKQDARAAG
ncbi:MAG: hypothetical protein ABJJ53_18300 [Sulfitobacter sp.]